MVTLLVTLDDRNPETTPISTYFGALIACAGLQANA